MRAQVMSHGCSCHFLHGKDTDEDEKDKMENALDNQYEYKTEILLYKKNGSPFWCLMDIVPIKNEKNQVVLFLVSHKDISREKLPHNNDGSVIDETGEFELSNTLQVDDRPTNYNYGRRRSRAVLYQLSGQFNKPNTAKTKFQKLNKQLNVMPEYKVQGMKKSKFILLHCGIFKISWDWLILLCTFYVAIVVPYNAAFTITVQSSVYTDVFVEILFTLDILLNFRTTYVNLSGQVICNPREIAIHYFRGWFVLDLIAAIPFELLVVLRITTGTPIHLLKLARLLRLARLLQKIERFSQYSTIVLALFMMTFTLLGHWLACIWYLIGMAEVNDMSMNRTAGWLYELAERLESPIHNRSNLPSPLTSYVTSLYFTCSSLTSVGFGNVSANTDAEKIFSICTMLVGALMHAVIFGNVTAIIQRMYARRSTYHSKTRDLKDFFRTNHFPKALKNRMYEYFQTIGSTNHGIDANEILKDFPEEMQGEIGIHLNREILSLPIFENCTQGCLRAISLQVKRHFCAPGEYLIHKCDAVNYAYFLCSGSMEILSDEMVVAILGKGDLFGTELNFDDPVEKSGYDVRSLTYCEIQCLQIKGLVDILVQYPDFAEQFNEAIQKDLTYNLKKSQDSQDTLSIEATAITLPSIREESGSSNNSLSDDNEDDKLIPPKSPLPCSLTPSHATSLSPYAWEQSRSIEMNIGSLSPLPSSNSLSPFPQLSGRTSSDRRLKSNSRSPLIHGSKRDQRVKEILLGELQQDMEQMRGNLENMDERISTLSEDVTIISHGIKSISKMLSLHIINSCTCNRVSQNCLYESLPTLQRQRSDKEHKHPVSGKSEMNGNVFNGYITKKRRMKETCGYGTSAGMKSNRGQGRDEAVMPKKNAGNHHPSQIHKRPSHLPTKSSLNGYNSNLDASPKYNGCTQNCLTNSINVNSDILSDSDKKLFDKKFKSNNSSANCAQKHSKSVTPSVIITQDVDDVRQLSHDIISPCSYSDNVESRDPSHDMSSATSGQRVSPPSIEMLPIRVSLTVNDDSQSNSNTHISDV